MSAAEFVHLHVHTEFSLLDAACRLDKLTAKARELNFPAISITDHGNMFGAIDFYRAAKNEGVKPILGCEVYVAPRSRFEKKSSHGGKDVYNHLVLLAADNTGYHNLMKLVSNGFLEGYYYKPRIDKELLEQHKEGLIVLSGCLASEIPTHIKNGDLEKARESVDWFKQTFGAENFFLELQDHGIPEQAEVNRHLIPWSKEFGLKLVATNDVHYIEKEHSHAHDSLICIGSQSQLSDTKRMRYVPEQFYLRSAEEMANRFSEVPEAIRNTLEIADRCEVDIKFGVDQFPVITPPESYTREGYLRKILAEKFDKIYSIKVRPEGDKFILEGIDDARKIPTFIPEEGQTDFADHTHPRIAKEIQIYIDRVEYEMGTIESMGFVSYFLIIEDFIRYGRSKGISCVARGSAAGSLVTYLLEISNIDPIRYGLIFERFLNPERVNPPDVDIDFADDRRQEVIDYTTKTYGADCVAQIITFGTMGAKSVIRDVGRVMSLSYGEVDRLAKMIPNELKMTLKKALEQSPEFKQAYETEEITRELIDTAFILEDVTRNTSVHAAGVVIGNQPLVNLIPVKQGEEGTMVTQYPMGPVGDLGLLKMDFLGLKTLTVIRKSCEMIKAKQGIDVPIDDLPLDDEKTYRLLNNGNTIGVFQLESGGMRDLCRKFQIQSIEHITALISLYRPGPMDLIPEFIERRHGRVKVVYDHPLLEAISEETYGILIYQEQVMQAARVLAGYTLGGADILRRAMGKKKVEVMQEHRLKFVKGCFDINKIPEKKANKIFDLLEKFAGYGFNKSHAAAYAMVAYQTAYLKANYPAEFLSAMMTNDMSDLGKLTILIDEANENGIEVLGPDINESFQDFAPTGQNNRIRFGLAAVKGVGSAAVDRIIEIRDKEGAFGSLSDLCNRADGRTVNRKAMEALIKSGAMDALKENRPTLLSKVDFCMSSAATAAQDRATGQATLFGLMDEQPKFESTRKTALPDWEDAQKLAYEKELLGFYVSGHPIHPYQPILDKFSLCEISALASLSNGTLTRFGGLISAVQLGMSKKSGKPYAILNIEDANGSVSVLCINETYDQFRELFTEGIPVFVEGEVNNAEDKPKVFPSLMLPMDQVPLKYTTQVHFRLRTETLNNEQLKQLQTLAQEHPGKCPLFLCMIRPNGDFGIIETHDSYGVTPSSDLQSRADELFGDDTYYAKADRTPPEARKRFRRAGNQNGKGAHSGS